MFMDVHVYDTEYTVSLCSLSHETCLQVNVPQLCYSSCAPDPCPKPTQVTLRRREQYKLGADCPIVQDLHPVLQTRHSS